ncbi:unnamed protein product [Pneumocystis jirovecii]|uniref:Uncharacterized protein n=1 Tax=Pneumocystis jirovecii TaxID=42068 RepID=L0PBJ3_PNEJI|nr:unnamed protein product [Pneumocystis jirovecii]
MHRGQCVAGVYGSIRRYSTSNGAQRAAGSAIGSNSGAELQPARVPAGRLARLYEYGGLALGLGIGAVGEGVRRLAGRKQGGMVVNEANIARVVAVLSRMRGAALKIGQMISFQGR